MHLVAIGVSQHPFAPAAHHNKPRLIALQAPTSFELNQPGGVALDTYGNLYIADTGKLS
jgi:hypothetical protein